MLANVPPTGCDFHGLIRYLLNGSGDGRSPHNRVLWTSLRNLATDDPLTAARIMTATARQSTRVERPTYHLIISWTDAEAPSQRDMQAVAAQTLADIGLDRHQAVLVAHGDTNNPHVHMAINRVSPDTGRAWSTSHDYQRIERSMAVQACSRGFRVVQGRHTSAQAPKPQRIRTRGAMLSTKVDRTALVPWTRARVEALSPGLADIVAHASSWATLHDALRQAGYALEPKRAGVHRP